MGIRSVAEIWSGRSGVEEAITDASEIRAAGTYSQNDRVRVWRVITTSNGDGDAVVLAAPTIAKLWDSYVDRNGNADSACFCRRRRAEQDHADPKVWTVRAEYTSSVTVSPLERPARWRWERVPYTMASDSAVRVEPILGIDLLDLTVETTAAFSEGDDVVLTDDLGHEWTTTIETISAGVISVADMGGGIAEDDNPHIETAKPVAYRNSAGDKLDGAPPLDDHRRRLVYTRNEATFARDQADEFEDAINSDEFLGAAPGKAKCAAITAQHMVEADGQTFEEVTYEFEFSRRGFAISLLDAGLRQIDVNNPTRLDSIRTHADGQPAGKEVPLNGAGLELPRGQKPVFVRFRNGGRKKFAELNIVLA